MSESKSKLTNDWTRGADTKNDLPNWIEGKPAEPGVYVGFSTNPMRKREKASLYTYDGKVWQHWSGFYDHAVTHYLPTDLPPPEMKEPAHD